MSSKGKLRPCLSVEQVYPLFRVTSIAKLFHFCNPWTSTSLLCLYRQDAHEEWSNRAFHQPPSGPLTIRPSDWSEAPIRGPSCQLSADTLDLTTAGGRVGADVLLTFPEGEEDAVTITRSDLAGLQPTKFLGNNIIDFYVKYLKSTILSSEHQKRFHFFNSFFFT